MSHWSDGYLTTIDYINHYSTEMSLNYLTVPFLMNKLAPPEIKTYCELGFGQGYNIVVNSLTTTADCYGTDFLPGQVLKARKLNALGGNTNIQLFEQSFAEFCNREDLPDFDMIMFHGIWSWISDENRQVIIDFIRRKLKVGGVVYASYNVLPAWSQILPLKHMLTTQYNLTPKSLSVEKRVSQALDKVNKLVACSPSLEKKSPVFMSALNSVNEKNAAYVAHEYLNAALKPMYFDEIAKLFDQAKLTFACGVRHFDCADEWVLNDTQRTFLQDIDDPILREVQKDTMLMRWFRRDYWVKGVDKLSDDETLERWKQVRVVLIKESKNINPTYSGAQDIKIGQALLQATLSTLEDYQIHTVGEIIDTLSDKYQPNKIIETVALLISKQDIEIAQTEEAIKAVKQRCLEFNHKILDGIFESSLPNSLISPVSARLIHYSDIDLLFIKAMLKKIPTNEQAEWVWQYLQKYNKVLSDKEQQKLNKEESLKVLNNMIEDKESYQKIIQALQLI